jgi:hypothetical protein
MVIGFESPFSQVAFPPRTFCLAQEQRALDSDPFFERQRNKMQRIVTFDEMEPLRGAAFLENLEEYADRCQAGFLEADCNFQGDASGTVLFPEFRILQVVFSPRTFWAN